MNFPKANSFPQSTMRERSMGPNPLKLCEELLDYADIPAGSVVLDLGSGAGLTSALMAREYGLIVYAADLWSDPSDNMRFFEECGLVNRQVIPLKSDATALPFAHGFFDAVVCVDSYNYSLLSHSKMRAVSYARFRRRKSHTHIHEHHSFSNCGQCLISRRGAKFKTAIASENMVM